MEWLIEIIIPYARIFSYAGVALALLITAIGFPVPEDIILLTAGFIAAEGYANIYLMIVLAMVAILGGDLLMYGLGYYFGKPIFNIRPFSRIFTPARQAKTQNFYNHYGKTTIFAGRFAPGLRAGIYLLAGASRMKVRLFLLMDFLAALISVPLIVWLGFFFNTQVKQVAGVIAQSKLIALLIVLIIILAILVYRRTLYLKGYRARLP